jgi:beta-galactosidase
MKKTNRFLSGAVLTAFVLTFLSTGGAAWGQQVRKVENIDKTWQFLLGDAENAQDPAFDDSAWRTLDVPHDWSIEGDYDPEGPVKRGGGYRPAGVGWYRKTLTFPSSDADKKVLVHFDGVMANSDIWINGHHLGHRPFGYIPLVYDLTDYITFDGTPNVIAVRCDNTVQPASRWYTGAGIYRHVQLVTQNPVHLKQWSIYITTPEITDQNALISIQAAVTNQTDAVQTVTVQTTLTSPSGQSVQTEPAALTVAPGQTSPLQQNVTVADPERWDITSPNLYTAVTTVSIDGRAIDDELNTFGIREMEFRPESGLWLNGRNVRIYGACLHHDGGAVGAAVPLSVWERRLNLLRELGCNAVRGAHNPMDEPFYDLLDRMGFLFLDETFDTWTYGKNHGQNAYNLYYNEWWYVDARDQLLRARNHPAIFAWSLGNEIRDNVNTPAGRQRFLNLLELTKELDPTRPITMALFRPQQAGLYENGFADLLGIVGQNYNEQGLLGAWQTKPSRVIMGTENTPSREAWVVMRDNPSYSGQFIWTGFDYFGESDWPQIAWNIALFDRNGGWRPLSWQRQSWWTDEPMVHIARREGRNGEGGLTSDWTPVDPDAYDQAHVEIYSNCEEVELFLDNTSLGRQSMPADASPAKYVLDFMPGTLKVVAYNGGQSVAEQQEISATEPVKVELTAEKAQAANDWDEVVYLTATVLDNAGIRCPNGREEVTFTISGPGEIVAVDNGDNFNHERFKTDHQTVYKGQAIAIIRATADTGMITVTASADGLTGSSVTLQATPKK